MKKYLLVFAVFIGITTVKSQNQALVKATLPFKLIKQEQHIIVPLVLNKQDSIYFYFDTGAASTLLDKTYAKKVGIKPNYEEKINGAGGKLAYEIAKNKTINLNGVTLDSLNIVLNDLSRLQKSLGHRFDGIIGNSLIKRYITEINIEEKKIKLYSKGAKLNTKGYTALPFRFKNDIPIPQFEVEIELSNGTKYKGDIFFDSGAGLNLLINTPFAEQHKLLVQAGKTLTNKTNNLSKESTSKDIKIKRLRLGEFTFSNFISGIANDKAGVSSFKGYLGILGAGIINKFNMILDYDKKIMYLKPNSLFKKQFKIPLIGFSIKKDENKKVVISDIYAESKAYKAGIRKGDEVISINGKKCTEHFKKCSALLKKKGKRVKIQVKQANKVLKFKTTIKEIL